MILTCVLVLSSLVLIAYSVGQARRLAVENKQYIACIGKDLATPLPPDKQHKVIENLYSTCDIKFTR